MQQTTKRNDIPDQRELIAKAKLLDVPTAQLTPDKSIGEVSALTDLSIDTLRYYEKLGLIEPIARDLSGRRTYSDLDVERIGFVRRLRATGMPVETIAHHVGLRAQGPDTADDRLHMLLDHRNTLLHMQQELTDSLELLDSKVTYYRQLIDKKDRRDTGHGAR